MLTNLMNNTAREKPLLSIIIPCYNNGRFLADAILSCQKNGQPSTEIIVMDDGSTDHTRAVTLKFPDIIYVYQQNKGLPAARNAGFQRSTGQFISFLDADDWYLPDNLSINLDILQNHPDAAFISGCHYVQTETGALREHCLPVPENPFTDLLRANYIGNPSTVIYRREILDTFSFCQDPGIHGCEDYDHYLRITRKHRVLHNPIPISVYRRHPGNMSNNLAMMLNAVLNVLLRQKPLLRSEEEEKAWQQGWEDWMKYYSYFPLRSAGNWQINRAHLALIRKFNLSLPIVLWKKIRHS